MAAVEGSLEEEAFKRRDRLKALGKKSGLPDEQVAEKMNFFNFLLSLRSACNTRIMSLTLSATFS